MPAATIPTGQAAQDALALPWPRCSCRSSRITKRGLRIVAWMDLAGEDEAARRRCATKEHRRPSRPIVPHYRLERGPPTRSLREAVAGLSDGRCSGS